MEHYDGTLGDVLDVLHGAVEVHPTGVGVIISTNKSEITRLVLL